MSKNEFMSVLESVETWVARDSFAKRGFCTYNETAVLGARIRFITDCIKPLLISFAAFVVIYSATVSSLLMAQQIAVPVNTHCKLKTNISNHRK